MAKKWSDLTPQEKMEWFDNSIKQYEDLSVSQRESRLKKIREARSKAKAGQRRHKKKHWWNH